MISRRIASSRLSLPPQHHSGDGEPQRVRGEVVTERYPSVLGVAPLMGRPFTWDEVHKAGTPPAAMISHGLWTRRFGGDPAVVGRTIRINATPIP